MKYIKYIGFTSLIAGSLLVGSCTDELDLSPTDKLPAESALNTGENIERILLGAYDALSDGDLFGGNALRDSELLGSDGDLQFSGTYGEPAEVWRKELVTSNSDVAERWYSSYYVINATNIVLDNLELVDEEEQGRVQGEALFLRGLAYFELVKYFGKPYSAGNTTTNLAVPIITEPTYEFGDITYPERQTVEAVYARVLEDLQQAEDLLPTSNGVYANKTAAAAILSRAYLQMLNYEGARDAANRGLAYAQGVFSLVPVYENAFNNTTNSSEDVLSTQVTTQDGVNNMQLFFASTRFGGRGDIEIQNQHLSEYEEGDERLALFYSDPVTGESRTGKWVDQYANVNLIRLAELYLTRAEANARLGTEVGASPADDVNLIRERAGLDPIDNPTVDDIVRERFLELAFEGQRVHDMKRLQWDIDGFEYDAFELIFPIPQREIDANESLRQNEGYF
ncbi:RagB/SusD family nutrient uptake outer membrane protein [Cesiribacter sp. SM1]|uniref:RagB/SusD family nutrient uptake outer membrane protein n=1 Tax=Cesiribacter sp. SM1 TaxID=2861196 RepID=UPI001CD7868D|nr:RagB/SusD family nutrient uptake outer membrane protein [Cesiribacter sp. SM1]